MSRQMTHCGEMVRLEEGHVGKRVTTFPSSLAKVADEQNEKNIRNIFIGCMSWSIWLQESPFFFMFALLMVTQELPRLQDFCGSKY